MCSRRWKSRDCEEGSASKRNSSRPGQPRRSGFGKSWCIILSKASMSSFSDSILFFFEVDGVVSTLLGRITQK